MTIIHRGKTRRGNIIALRTPGMTTATLWEIVATP